MELHPGLHQGYQGCSVVTLVLLARRRWLLEMEEQKRKAEQDKLAAITELERQSREFMVGLSPPSSPPSPPSPRLPVRAHYYDPSPLASQKHTALLLRLPVQNALPALPASLCHCRYAFKAHHSTSLRCNLTDSAALHP